MINSNRSVQLSEEKIRGIYAQGEEAVVSLVTQLLERIKSLEKEVKELQGRLNKDNHNSSKPPSSDGFGKRTKSLRRKSEKPSGGQTGHRGQTLEWQSKPDVVERHGVEVCSGSGTSLAGVGVEEVIARQVLVDCGGSPTIVSFSRLSSRKGSVLIRGGYTYAVVY